MTTKVRMWFAVMMLAATLMFVAVSEPTFAALGGDMRPDVQKIADAFKGGKGADAKSSSSKLAPKFEENSDLMHLFRPHNKGGMGWGGKRLANPANDGLEKGIQTLAKGVTNVAKDALAAEEGAYALAAMAELILNKTPKKDASGGKTKKAWNEWAEQMRDASLELAKAAGAKKPDAGAIQKAAAKVNATCNNCHSKFKE